MAGNQNKIQSRLLDARDFSGQIDSPGDMPPHPASSSPARLDLTLSSRNVIRIKAQVRPGDDHNAVFPIGTDCDGCHARRSTVRRPDVVAFHPELLKVLARYRGRVIAPELSDHRDL
jgi:hypothetical protein